MRSSQVVERHGRNLLQVNARMTGEMLSAVNGSFDDDEGEMRIDDVIRDGEREGE